MTQENPLSVSADNQHGNADESWTFVDSKTVEIPIRFLLELHNSLPRGHEGRSRIKSMIRVLGERKEKAHWTRGIIVDENDNLQVDDGLYSLAVYRGKQETYIGGAKKLFDQLQKDLEFVALFQKREEEYSHALIDASSRGRPLVEVRELGHDAALLKARADRLNELVKQMEYGMAECLAGRDNTFHQIDQSKTEST